MFPRSHAFDGEYVGEQSVPLHALPQSRRLLLRALEADGLQDAIAHRLLCLVQIPLEDQAGRGREGERGREKERGLFCFCLLGPEQKRERRRKREEEMAQKECVRTSEKKQRKKNATEEI